MIQAILRLFMPYMRLSRKEMTIFEIDDRPLEEQALDEDLPGLEELMK